MEITISSLVIKRLLFIFSFHPDRQTFNIYHRGCKFRNTNRSKCFILYFIANITLLTSCHSAYIQLRHQYYTTAILLFVRSFVFIPLSVLVLYDFHRTRSKWWMSSVRKLIGKINIESKLVTYSHTKNPNPKTTNKQLTKQKNNSFKLKCFCFDILKKMMWTVIGMFYHIQACDFFLLENL